MGAKERLKPVWAPQSGPQTLLITCPFEDILFGGSRGGGKTDGCLGRWVSRWARYGNPLRGMMIRRTYDELDEVVARSLEIYPALGADWAAGKRTWYFPGGARLKMRSMRRDEDASKYQGHSYTDIMVDEGGNFPDPAPIDKLQATIRNTHGIPGSMVITANPGGPGHEWIKKRYIDPAPTGMQPIADGDGTRNRIYIPSRLEHNQLLLRNDPNYAHRLRQSGPSWLVNAWLNGDWNATPEGGLIKLAWFQRYTIPLVTYRRIVQSWDTGIKEKEINDPSVCTTWGETPNGYHLLHVHRERLIYPDLKRRVGQLAETCIANAILIEDKASGQSLIQDLKASTTLPVIGIEPKGNKVDRLIEVSGMIESGLVYLPEIAPWLLDFELELSIFPLSAHDDQVDSLSQFLKWAGISAGRISHTSARTSQIATAGIPEQRNGWGRIRGNEYGGY